MFNRYLIQKQSLITTDTLILSNFKQSKLITTSSSTLLDILTKYINQDLATLLYSYSKPELISGIMNETNKSWNYSTVFGIPNGVALDYHASLSAWGTHYKIINRTNILVVTDGRMRAIGTVTSPYGDFDSFLTVEDKEFLDDAGIPIQEDVKIVGKPRNLSYRRNELVNSFNSGDGISVMVYCNGALSNSITGTTSRFYASGSLHNEEVIHCLWNNSPSITTEPNDNQYFSYGNEHNDSLPNTYGKSHTSWIINRGYHRMNGPAKMNITYYTWMINNTCKYYIDLETGTLLQQVHY